MTADQVNGYIRTLCTILGTLSGAGLALNAGQINIIEQGLLGLSSLAFLAFSLYGSWQAHSAKGVITSAAAVPGTQIVTQPAIAAETPVNVRSSADASVISK